MPLMTGYGQFCPIARGSEVVAQRWTPLILREIMSGVHFFNDIHRGVPLISRGLLSERLKQMAADGLLHRRPIAGTRGGYHLTEAGEALRPIVAALGYWALNHLSAEVTRDQLDPGFLMWALRIRTDLSALPEKRVVVRFEFSGVPASRNRLKVMWMVLERDGADVCAKDPGHPIDLLVNTPVELLVSVFLGKITWKEAIRHELKIEGDRKLAARFPYWLRLDKLLGRDVLFLHVPPHQLGLR